MQPQSLCALIENDAPYSDIQQTISLAPVSVNTREEIHYHEMTPLHLAVNKKRWDVVELLVEKGADVNSICQGTTPLLSALSNTKDNRETPHPPLRILRLLRSEWNVNAMDEQKETPLSSLLDKEYSMCISKEAFDQRTVDSGLDTVLISNRSAVYLQRRPPLEILRCFATRENVNQYINIDKGCLLPGLYMKPNGSSRQCRWELVLLYLSLGADIEQVRDRVLEELQGSGNMFYISKTKKDSAFDLSNLSPLVETAPPFLRNILTNKGRKFAPYEYLPYVYVTINKQPLSLKLGAAVAAKKLVTDLEPSEELERWRALGVPRCFADYIVDLDKNVELWGEKTSPQLTAAEMDNLSWY